MIFRAFVFTLGLLLIGHPAYSKNIAFPSKDPIGTIVLPDDWKLKSIDYGWEAKSPKDDVYFSIEIASDKSFDKMMAATKVWMKENKIKFTKESEDQEVNLGGLKGFMKTYQGTDENGPTTITWFLVGTEKVYVMLTFWASDEELDANKAAVLKIIESVKAIN
jgi:hypothetical protein